MIQKEKHLKTKDTIKKILAGQFSKEDLTQVVEHWQRVNREPIYRLWDGQAIHFDGRPQQIKLLDGTIINF